MIKFSRDEWIPLQQRLLKEHGLAIMNISWVCRRELGFTIRRGQLCNDSEYSTDIYLDFFDDTKETFFRLKYI
jgi:hypothetical protein